MRLRRLPVLLAVLGLLVVAVPFRAHLRRACVAMVQRAQGLTPVDFRTRELPAKHPPLPAWAPDLYAVIRRELAQFTGARNHYRPANSARKRMASPASSSTGR